MIFHSLSYTDFNLSLKLKFSIEIPWAREMKRNVRFDVSLRSPQPLQRRLSLLLGSRHRRFEKEKNDEIESTIPGGGRGGRGGRRFLRLEQTRKLILYSVLDLKSRLILLRLTVCLFVSYSVLVLYLSFSRSED